MISRILTILVVFCALQLQSQNPAPANKLTLTTYLYLNKQQPETILPVLIKGDAEQIIGFLRTEGGQYKFTTGDIVSATLTKNAILKLNRMDFVKQIDCAIGKLELMNDVMVIRNNVDSAYNGIWPLDQSYDGTGVVIGIIDAPFDINHGDFKDIDGNTRIKYVWDQNVPDDGTSPDPYNYGSECDSAMVANGTCAHNDFEELNYSHGSGVTGVAASSGYAANRYRGVAPNADLILVAINFYDNYETNLTDAIKYIYDKAAELNKPCVINTSLGSYAGSHDGKDLLTQTIDNLISETNRRSLVAAAGNAGNIALHVGYDVTATEQFTWFKKLSYTNLAYFELFADKTDFDNVFFSIGADNPTGWINVGETADLNILNDFDLVEGGIDSALISIPGAGSGYVYAQLMDGVYQLDFVITPSVSSYYWRLTTHGTGRVDMYNAESTTGYSNYVTTGLPDAGTVPEIVNYKAPDFTQNIVSSWQCSDKVITVGSYVNRDSMTNYYGDNPPFFDTPGEIFIASSHGPTRDNRIKPDLCATGSRILSTEAQILSDWLISLGAANYMSPDGMHYLYNGTSFSSPVVAGVAALYFQKNPEADYNDVRDAIINNAKHDTFTGEALPDNEWGYGKVDAFRTLTGSWGCSEEDYTNPPQNITFPILLPTKVNIVWDLIPNAAGYQVAIQKSGEPYKRKNSVPNEKVFSGLVPNTTYNCKVRAFCAAYGFSNYSDVVTFTTPPLKEGEIIENDYLIYPVPASSELFIDGVAGTAVVRLFNMLGEEVQHSTIQSENSVINISELPNGVYQIYIEENNIFHSQTIFISR